MSEKDTSKTPAGPDLGAVPEVDDKNLQRELEQARKVAERRVLEAPDIQAGKTVDPDNVISATITRLKQKGSWPKTDGKDNHPFWGDREHHRHYISQGYMPVIEDRKMVTYKELILYSLPWDIYWASEMSAVQKSQERMRSVAMEGKDAKTRIQSDDTGMRQPMVAPRTAEARARPD